MQDLAYAIGTAIVIVSLIFVVISVVIVYMCYRYEGEKEEEEEVLQRLEVYCIPELQRTPEQEAYRLKLLEEEWTA